VRTITISDDRSAHKSEKFVTGDHTRQRGSSGAAGREAKALR
jgi:hypothetical protein